MNRLYSSGSVGSGNDPQMRKDIVDMAGTVIEGGTDLKASACFDGTGFVFAESFDQEGCPAAFFRVGTKLGGFRFIVNAITVKIVQLLCRRRIPCSFNPAAVLVKTVNLAGNSLCHEALLIDHSENGIIGFVGFAVFAKIIPV